ncbi:MAG: hypothetical protein HKL88_05440 [Bacteroidia bacterium]|jgi:uncharacterized protein YktA (UPF0223 family)|nr:hypothetical protein [Bacteroidia bacterium]
MKRLGVNWITENQIDFEYKKYILLAYLQDVAKDFDMKKLYPALKELYGHYKQVVSIKQNKEELRKGFPQEAKDIDTEKMALVYDSLFSDTALMQEVESIINYSIPQFEKYLERGREIYDFIDRQITISPVGIVPLDSREGYIFIRDGKGADTQVFEYDISLFEQPDGKYRGIHTQYIKTCEAGIQLTYQYIKLEMMKEKKELPNPAAYAIESELPLPLAETLLPIAKMRLLQFVAGKES